MNWKFSTIVGVSVLFAVSGLAVACVDIRDHWRVDPTDDPSDVLTPADEPLTINEAKREVQVIRDDTNRWIDWRNADIAKEEQKVAFIEGVTSSGLSAVAESAGTWAGPFAPLATLLIGYATKRRKDRTPDEVAQEKRDSYNKGVAVGKAIVQAVSEKGKADS